MLESLKDALRLVDKKLEQIKGFVNSTKGIYQNADAAKESLRRAISCIDSSTFDNNMINYRMKQIDREWTNKIKNQWIEKEIREKELYINAMKECYGFDDETSQILYNLYYRMRNAGVTDLNQKYFAILASVVYGDTEGFDIKTVAWEKIAGIYDKESWEQILEEYGLTKAERDKLRTDLNNKLLLTFITVKAI